MAANPFMLAQRLLDQGQTLRGHGSFNRLGGLFHNITNFNPSQTMPRARNEPVAMMPTATPETPASPFQNFTIGNRPLGLPLNFGN